MCKVACLIWLDKLATENIACVLMDFGPWYELQMEKSPLAKLFLFELEKILDKFQINWSYKTQDIGIFFKLVRNDAIFLHGLNDDDNGLIWENDPVEIC